MTQKIKDDVLLNIKELREVISNISKSERTDFLPYYEQILRMQEYILVEIISEEDDKSPNGTVTAYLTDNFGSVTPETAKILVRSLGSIRGINS